MSKRSITIYHSPDSDDAFMFYGLASGNVTHPDFDFSHELQDIESLNHLAQKGELEVTAVSVHGYAYLKNRYSILTTGASLGGSDYGPCLVMREPTDLFDGTIRTIAIPGRFTSSALAFQIYLKEEGVNAKLVIMNFNEIDAAVSRGEVDGGIIIHEGQLTHQKKGLSMCLDLGKWWWDKYALPLPLGINVVRNDLGEKTIFAVKAALKKSIEYALSHRDAALDYALEYGRGITKEEADTFVEMYVNKKTVDMGKEGQEAITLFLSKGVEYGFIPENVEPVFV